MPAQQEPAPRAAARVEPPSQPSPQPPSVSMERVGGFKKQKRERGPGSRPWATTAHPRRVQHALGQEAKQCGVESVHRSTLGAKSLQEVAREPHLPLPIRHPRLLSHHPRWSRCWMYWSACRDSRALIPLVLSPHPRLTHRLLSHLHRTLSRIGCQRWPRLPMAARRLHEDPPLHV